MIDEFKDIIIKFFSIQGKVLNRETIKMVFFFENDDQVIGFFTTSMPCGEYYGITYNKETENFVLDVYQKTKICKAERADTDEE